MYRRSRSRTALLAAATLVVGLLARFALPGVLGNVVGGLLYTVMVFWVVVLVWPRTRSVPAAVIAAAVAVGIELLQLTGLPAALSTAFPPARLVLGTTFSVEDLLVAVLGAAVAWLVDRLLRGWLRAPDD